MSEPTWLVIGLGNPDSSVATTRHIVGRLVVELLANGRPQSLQSHRRGRADETAGQSLGVWTDWRGP